MSGRVIDNDTGRVEYNTRADFEAPPWAFGDVQNAATNAAVTAQSFTGPIKWLIVTGAVVWFGYHLLKRVK